MVVKSHLHKITLDFEKEIFLTITTTNLYKTKNMSDSSYKLQEMRKLIVMKFHQARTIEFRTKSRIKEQKKFRTKIKFWIKNRIRREKNFMSVFLNFISRDFWKIQEIWDDLCWLTAARLRLRDKCVGWFFHQKFRNHSEVLESFDIFMILLWSLTKSLSYFLYTYQPTRINLSHYYVTRIYNA